MKNSQENVYLGHPAQQVESLDDKYNSNSIEIINEINQKGNIQLITDKLNKLLPLFAIILVILFYWFSSTNNDKYKQPFKIIQNNFFQDQQDFKLFVNLQIENIKSKNIQNPKQLYQNILKQKYNKHKNRNILFINKSTQQNFNSLKLSQYNMIHPNINNKQMQQQFNRQKFILQNKYKLNQYQQQISICIVISGQISNKQYSYQYIINSILNQQYQNYQVIYIADGYTSDQIKILRRYIQKRDSNKKIKLIRRNSDNTNYLQSNLYAIQNHCLKNRVTALINQNDQLLGRQVFRLINTFYRRYNLNMLYGNFIQYYQSRDLFQAGFAKEYEDKTKKQEDYRSVGQRFGKIMTFKTKLVRFINPQDLKDQKDQYYKYAGDYAIIYPLLELSCGKVMYMPEFNYLYYSDEISADEKKIQDSYGKQIKAKNRYKCFNIYN